MLAELEQLVERAFSSALSEWQERELVRVLEEFVRDVQRIMSEPAPGPTSGDAGLAPRPDDAPLATGEAQQSAVLDPPRAGGKRSAGAKAAGAEGAEAAPAVAARRRKRPCRD